MTTIKCIALPQQYPGTHEDRRLNIVIGNVVGTKLTASTYSASIMPNGDDPKYAENRRRNYVEHHDEPYGWVRPNAGCLAANPMDGTYGDIVRAKQAGTWVASLEAGDILEIEGVGTWEAYRAPNWSGELNLRPVAR